MLDARSVRSNLERVREIAVSKWPVVMCPGCKVPMGVKAVIEDRPGAGSGQVTYACVICKTETVRPFKGAQTTQPRPPTFSGSSGSPKR